jgi:integrase
LEKKPIRYVNTKAWRNALKRAGIADFHWHDLRHTWASWLIQHGTPLYDLKEMGGSRPRWCGATRTWRR